jgi:hypothetical protein
MLLCICIALLKLDVQRRGSICANFLHSYQSIILLLCIIFCVGNNINSLTNILSLDIILHYLVMTDEMLFYSFTLTESLKFVCFFLMCQYYSKQALNFIPTKKKWMKSLKILMMTGISISVVGGAVLMLQSPESRTGNQLCTVPIFLIMRAGGEIVVFFFLAVGVMLTKALREMDRET